MKRSRHIPEQIAFALRQAESGTTVGEVCRKMGIAEKTFYRWKKIYEGMGVAEVRRLKVLEEENRKLKQLVSNLGLDKQMLQEVLRKSPRACSDERPRRLPKESQRAVRGCEITGSLDLRADNFRLIQRFC